MTPNQALSADFSGDRDRAAHTAAALVALMARLRSRERGCPWDVEQTFETIAPYTIEEAYEVADAIARRAMPDLKEELGDLLFQVLFHARMAEEQGAFDFFDVAETLIAKMTERHPHVFGASDARTADEQTQAWETQKAHKRAARGAGLLDDVALALPALQRAEKLTKRAARIGFDWPDADAVLVKLSEELGEIRDARAEGDQAHIEEEVGDALFVMANLARKLNVDPEEALRRANAKFTRRFEHIERRLAETGREGPQPLAPLEALWEEAKRAERA
ncbi:MAG: nucleoside triphosphate pyrophosphohydrolase [Alphaproteobacteria bacterium]|nr:nucleoside triphosphate pyrophosphohydrolase [Alphaproteobacteria bacterium]